MDETLSHDFWTLAERSLALPEETQSYVPKIFAVMTLLRNPRAYGFEPFVERPPSPVDTIAVPPAMPLELLARALAIPVNELRGINPEILVDHVPTTRGANVVRIPESRVELSELVFSGGDDDGEHELLRELARVQSPQFSLERARCFPMGCRGNRDTNGWKQVRDALDAASRRIYRVKPGDSLQKLAALFGTSAKRIMSENKVRDPHALRVGQLLRVPVSETM
ncbi:MAG: LysM peptidoglycan-binding domain-containing protein [Polyangiaceae bacterium]